MYHHRVLHVIEQSYITGASTFYDRVTAERLVNLALTDSNNIEKIEKWLNDPDSDNKLALKFRGNENIGKGIKRNNGELEDYKNARIVLKKDGQGSYILTGFPTK